MPDQTNPANTTNQVAPSSTTTASGSDENLPAVPTFQESPTTQPPAPDTVSLNPPPPPEPNITTGTTGDNTNQKKILAALAIFLMLVGLGAGVFLIRNQQLSRISAWDCSLYSFSLSPNGAVTVANGSSHSQSSQQAQVYINNNLVDTFNVPALASGAGATLGSISVPTGQAYTWKIVGTVDCQNSGSVQSGGLTASCSAVSAYDENWNHLSANQLAQLEAGDEVFFAVSGTASSGTFQKARFSVNGAQPVEVTDKRPGSQDFYYKYKIPAGVTTFKVDADMLHSELGWF